MPVMGRKALPKSRTLDPEVRQKWLNILVPYFLKNGLRRVTMDDIARLLGVSKATIYEHFNSRDELFEMAVDYILDQIGGNKDILYRSELSYQDRFLHLFGLVLKQVIGITPILLEDIKYQYPLLWQKIQDYYQDWELTLQDFFKMAMKDGSFTQVHPALISRLITGVLREFINPEFLVSNQITIEQAFLDMLTILSQGVMMVSQENQKELRQKVRDIMIGTLFFPAGGNMQAATEALNEKMD